MENSYQLGPIAISKSFVQQLRSWPGIVVAIIVVLAIVSIMSGHTVFFPSPPTPTIKAQVFPLNQQLSKPIIYSSGTTIYRTTGRTQDKLYEVGSEVRSLAMSDDGSHLAATYRFSPSGSNSAGYPYTGLIFWDIGTGKSLPVIAKAQTTVRYPQWSSDGRYLSFWVNEGDESFIYDTAKRRPIFSVKKDGSTAISPITFFPKTNGIVYVKDGTLYSSAADGTGAIALAQGASSTGTPIISPSGAYIAFYAMNNDLDVLNTTTREVKAVSPGATFVGFLGDDQLLYVPKANEAGKAPTFLFSIANAKSSRVSDNTGYASQAGGAWKAPQAIVPVSLQNMFYLPSAYANLGPQLMNKDGSVAKDCSAADFHYEYNNMSDTSLPSSRQVVSPDGKYLAGTSGGSLSVLDTTTCQPYIITDTHPSVMTWAP